MKATARNMTDTQFYIAIGIPAALFSLNFIAILWQSRGLERSFNVRFEAINSRFEAIDVRFKAIDVRFEALEKIIIAKFEAQTQGLLRVEQVLDARLKHLEER